MTLSAQIRRRIVELEIYTHRLLAGQMVGDSRSAQKGSGFDFDQIREYQIGDDVRSIDWSATARADRMLVKQYRQERSRTIIIALDISASSFFNATTYKHTYMAEVAAVLTLVAERARDKVGLILFSDTIEKYIPPALGHAHYQMVIEAVFGERARSKKTSLESCFTHLARLNRKDAIVFIISDFIDDKPIPLLPSLAAHYDITAICCNDKREKEFPAVGFLEVEDIETGQQCTVDIRSESARRINKSIAEGRGEQKKKLQQYGIHVLDLETDQPFIADMIRFLRRKMDY